VVADGVSSSFSAYLAARAAVDAAGTVLEEAIQSIKYAQDGNIDWEGVTRAALETSQGAVLRVPHSPQIGSEAPSCTFVSAIWDGESIIVGWAGDSRAYWVCPTEARQLTSDNSWIREEGELNVNPDDPRAHAITQWLGLDAPSRAPQIATFKPAECGRLILCSDGLWNYAPTTEAFAELVQGYSAAMTPIDLARALASYALARGGHDNVTVAVADLPNTEKTWEEVIR
jgi:serine/threonine protein phosphatase PrpC